MDWTVGFCDWNIVRRLSSWVEYVELSQNFTGLYPVPNDLRFAIVLSDANGNSLRVGDSMEDGLGHKNFEGT
jgi:hypothetical protein